MISRLHTLIRRMASLRLTLACLALAAAIALAGQAVGGTAGVWIALPFAMLFFNLLAALAVTPKLRRHAGLLGFHLALAALAMLAAFDRLVSLSGHVEVTEGIPFDSRMVEAEAGPLHPWRLDQVNFVQGEFVIDYAPAMRRLETRSTVLLSTADGHGRSVVVGDDDPVVVGDYRFYTSFNKGFAPVLTYVDAAGRTHTGAVHLPSYPLNYYKQGNGWTLPDGKKQVKLWLHVPEPVYDPDGEWRFRKPVGAVLIVMSDGERHELHTGDDLALGDGRLRYDELRTWMGYTISYNPFTPWMLAAVLVGILCLAWHMALKFINVPWQTAGAEREGRDAC